MDRFLGSMQVKINIREIKTRPFPLPRYATTYRMQRVVRVRWNGILLAQYMSQNNGIFTIKYILAKYQLSLKRLRKFQIFRWLQSVDICHWLQIDKIYIDIEIYQYTSISRYIGVYRYSRIHYLSRYRKNYNRKMHRFALSDHFVHHHRLIGRSQSVPSLPDGFKS